MAGQEAIGAVTAVATAVPVVTPADAMPVPVASVVAAMPVRVAIGAAATDGGTPVPVASVVAAMPVRVAIEAAATDGGTPVPVASVVAATAARTAIVAGVVGTRDEDRPADPTMMDAGEPIAAVASGVLAPGTARTHRDAARGRSASATRKCPRK